MQYFKNNLHQALKGSDTKIDWENIPTIRIYVACDRGCGALFIWALTAACAALGPCHGY
jgi:hypothetical protein